MNKLTTERLEKFVSDIKTDGMCDITDHQVESALIRLLAYEQAEPVGEFYHEKQGGWYQISEGDKVSDSRRIPLYAAPVLPKQPEPVVLYMGRELISKEGLELIKDGVSEATQLESMCMASAILGGGYPAQPVIPEQQTVQLDPHVYRELVNELRDVALEYHSAHQLRERISRALSKAVTAAHPHLEQPVSEPYKFPDGWVMVPQEATIDMLKAGAKQAMKWEAFQYVWSAMLAAAPAQESE